MSPALALQAAALATTGLLLAAGGLHHVPRRQGHRLTVAGASCSSSAQASPSASPTCATSLAIRPSSSDARTSRVTKSASRSPTRSSSAVRCGWSAASGATVMFDHDRARSSITHAVWLHNSVNQGAERLPRKRARGVGLRAKTDKGEQLGWMDARSCRINFRVRAGDQSPGKSRCSWKMAMIGRCSDSATGAWKCTRF